MIANPLFVIKTRIFTQPAKDGYNGLRDGLTRVWREEGIKGLYRGFDFFNSRIIPALFGVSHGAIQFMVYEEMKIRRSSYMKGKPDGLTGVAETLVMAGGSKIIATVCTYPYQVVKSRMQTQSQFLTRQYSTVLSTISTIFRHLLLLTIDMRDRGDFTREWLLMY